MQLNTKTHKWLMGTGILGLAMAISSVTPWTAPAQADRDDNRGGNGNGNNGHHNRDDDHPGDYLNSYPGEFLGHFDRDNDRDDDTPRQLTDTQRAQLRQARLTRDTAILAALQDFLTAERNILGTEGAPLTTSQRQALQQARQTRDAAIAAAQRNYRLTVQQILTGRVPPGQAPVAFTSAVANVARDTITLRFNGGLNDNTAQRVGNFRVTVNGTPVTVQRATYSNSQRSITLTLPEETLEIGDQVVITWNGLRDFRGNVLTGSTTLTIPPAQSPVRVSSAVASVGNNLITLGFNGALNPTTASAVGNYRVTVNGTPVPVESAGYSETRRQVTLGLPVDTLSSGDRVVVSWNGLRDIHGATVTGSIGLNAR